MRVASLLASLRESGVADVEYRGDLDTVFDGFSISAAQTAVSGCCYFLIDDQWPFERSWPRAWQEHAASSPEEATDAVQLAFANGAACAVLPRRWLTSTVAEELDGSNIFVVEDSYRFYFEAGEALRALNTNCRFTAITGSVGKTSTTAMVAHAFESLGVKTFATQKSQNIGISVFRNISRAEGYQQAVIEVSYGACRSFVQQRCSPRADVAVITAIAEAHLADADSLETIAQVKSEIFAAAPPEGVAVICLDVPYSGLILDRAREANRRVVTYGESADAQIRLITYNPKTNAVTAEVAGTRITYTLGMGGRHNALNSLAVIGVLLGHGIEEWHQGIQSLSSLAPLPGRGERLELSISPDLQVSFINDAYNANPASVRSALDAFTADPAASAGRRIAILGDLLDLGRHSEAAHRSLASAVAAAELDVVILFGEEMKALKEELERGQLECAYFETLDTLISSLPDLLQSDDEVLAKASNSTGLAAWISNTAAGR